MATNFTTEKYCKFPLQHHKMIIALAFILTSFLQFYLYYRNYKKENKINEFLITISIFLIYTFIYPFFFYIFYENDNFIGFSFITQVVIIATIGASFTLITYIFWYFNKK